MIINIWRFTSFFVFSICVFAYPQNSFALETEQTPPFLLIEDSFSDDTTETKKHTVENQSPSIVDEVKTPANETDSSNLDDEEDDYLSEDIHVATSIAKPPFFSFLDDHQKLISNYLHLTVLSVDNFFATNEAINKSTGSHLRLSLETIWTEGKGVEYDGSISLRARLPGIKEKYRLVIESDPDEQQELLELESREREPVSTTSEDRGLFTGVEKNVGFFGWKARPSLGVKVRSPLDYYARLRIDKSEYFNKWALYLNESLYWFDSTGFGFDSTMRWDRPFNKMFLFRTTSLIRYTDLTDIYDLSQTAEVVQTLSKKRAITYKVGVFGNSENALHTTDYLVSMLYRQNVHSDYLFMDLQPQILFNKENNFEAQHELLLRLEIYYRD